MSQIVTLGEKRGVIYRNGKQELNEKHWDMIKASFEEAFSEETENEEEGDEKSRLN